MVHIDFGRYPEVTYTHAGHPALARDALIHEKG
jgi:hypothetical protein